MPENLDPPDLATLRELCGQPVPPDSSKKQRYMLRATRFNSPKQVRRPEDIATRLDNRPLLQLREQSGDAMREIVARAGAGDDLAIRVLLASARATIEALRSVEKIQPKQIRAIAETSSNWPVLLSPNPKDMDFAENEISRLRVGTKAAAPRRPGQKLDPRGFWTRLAETAFNRCRDNQVLLLALDAHCTGVIPQRSHLEVWGKTLEASLYYVSPTYCIVIADWEIECKNLSLPVTKANLKQWWHVIKHYVLEYWKSCPPEYEQALRQIGHEDEEQWWRRNKAVDRLEQAFRDLFDLRRRC